MRVPATSYDPVQRAAHWTTAVLFLAAVAIGLYCSFQAPGTSPRRELLEIHKSLGMSVLVLALFRLLYRQAAGVPGALPGPRWQTSTASATHAMLYAIMLAMPISGYLFSSAGGYSLRYFGLFSWPRTFAGHHDVSHMAERIHAIVAYLVYGIVALHVAGAAWHLVVLRDGTFRRMGAAPRLFRG